jgi:hypothetical protein
MTPEQLFSIANLLAIFGWVLLVAFPLRPRISALIASVAIPATLAVFYIALIVSSWGGPGGFGSLAEVSQLFSNPWLLLAGWIHYLAFDLLVGTWEAKDARAQGIPHVLVIPCLLLTFMFGPAGWLLYQGLKRIRRAHATDAASATAR